MREIALDTETTGLDPKSGHRIVEIGCVEMWGRIRTGKHFHVYINPERDVPPDAERIHGLSNKFLVDKPKFSEVVQSFVDFIGDSPLVIHNASFDLNFINYQLAALGYAMIPMERATDTVKIARAKFPGSPANLDALCRRFNIDLSARSFHGALLDAELLCDVYLELMGGRQAQMALVAENNANLELPDNRAIRPVRDFPIPSEELAAHEAFIAKKVKDALWEKLKEAAG
jgi:DNA polymerase-3 subunit epsilon